jgi:Fic family protein
MSNTPASLKKINSLRKRFYELSFNKEGLLKIISETEIADQVYNSNAIENSTLSLEETEKILLEIDLERYVSQRELFEAKNLARVVTYMESKALEAELNLDLMLFLHKSLLSNINDEIAGRFRQGNEWVKVGNHIGEDPKKVIEKIQETLIQYQGDKHENIIKRIAQFHLNFEHIHPFLDGNGRMGRVLNNFLLIREGYVPINIKFIDRSLYYDSFRQFNEDGNTSIMEEIIGKALTSSYHKRLAYLEGKEIVDLKTYASKMKTSHANAINKAKRQSIEAFHERGKWKIGI